MKTYHLRDRKNLNVVKYWIYGKSPEEIEKRLGTYYDKRLFVLVPTKYNTVSDMREYIKSKRSKISSNKTLSRQQKNFIRELDGTEIQYSDIGTVFVRGNKLIHNGEVVERITPENYDEVVEGYRMTEYGTTDLKQIMRMEGFEVPQNKPTIKHSLKPQTTVRPHKRSGTRGVRGHTRRYKK